MIITKSMNRFGEIVKHVRSPEYNYDLNTVNGTFHRWGRNLEDDPSFSKFGPELLDVEITTKCSGGCPYCYKSNTADGENMSFESFRKVIENIDTNRVLTQVAFGLGKRGDENPDLWKMCELLRDRGVMPNGTIADGTPETWDKISELFGACAVSAHTHWKNWLEILTTNVYELSLRGMAQVNCHFVLCEETYDDLMSLFHAKKADPRLEGLYAIVLLGMKRCGRAKAGGFTRLSDEKFREVVDTALSLGIGIGFDSCSASKFLKAVKDHPDYQKFCEMAEPCESMLFSQYVNVKGMAYPCSFMEDAGIPGFDVVNCKSFIDGFWNDEISAREWRKNLLNRGRECPEYDI